MRPCWVRDHMNFKPVEESEKNAREILPWKKHRRLTKWILPAPPSLPEQKTDRPTKFIRLVLGNDLHIFSNGNIGAKRTNCSTKLCTAKFVSKPYTSKRPPIGKLFHLKNCVKKNVYVPFFARNACLPYRKNGFKAHFFRFAHFFRYGFFYLKLVALPRALQSKRLGTTHFFCGGALHHTIVNLIKKLK